MIIDSIVWTQYINVRDTQPRGQSKCRSNALHLAAKTSHALLLLLAATVSSVNCTFEKTICGYSIINTTMTFELSYVISISSLGEIPRCHLLRCTIVVRNGDHVSIPVCRDK